ncbi:MAG TPA: glycosyltransferase family 4 protein [Opitutus sp.]|nr:glycosyltransferase family 4 protein [Opitutus sp.]
MKILHILPQGEVGGAERITLDWIRHSQGEHAAVVGGEGRLRALLERHGCRVHTVRPWRPRNVWSLVPEVAAIVEREQVDLLQSSNYDGHLLGGLLRWRTRRPEIWFNHGPIERVAWSRHSRFLPADALLVPTRYIEREQRRQGFWARRIIVHQYGIDTKVFAADPEARSRIRRQLALTDEVCIAMIARFDPGKGQALLVSALQEVGRRRPDLRFRLVLVGGTLRLQEAHAYEQTVRAQVEHSALASITTFAGHAEDVTGYLNAADIVVVASTAAEGLCLSLLEGMAMQKPTVAPNEGGPMEVVRDGRDGFLFPPRDSHALARRLETTLDGLVSDRARLLALGAEARQTVEARYDVRKSAQRLDEIYRRTINRNAGSAG